MKLIYSGKTKEFTPELEKKVTTKLAKLSKFIEQRGEREAHLAHQVERHLHKVVIEVNFYDHTLIGEGVDADLDTALCDAVEKLETQTVKLRNRWRDTHRDAKGTRLAKETPEGNFTPVEDVGPQKPAKNSKSNGTGTRPKIFRVDYEEDRKPMTLEEAVLEMENDLPYVVYRDSDRNCLSVLLRRSDGNYDLIES
ncbi:MAG TPA: ribosome-associated translation inhibitor RaiA [Bryobacteraceae bacterium]|nr:ribosome-associated translation inhibitor RaiA [Bryobacteraceae bacterium]